MLSAFSGNAQIPRIPDLAISYIHREPLTPSWRGQVVIQDGIPVLKESAPKLKDRWPASGTGVTFTAAVNNYGGEISNPAECVWFLDGMEAARVTIPPLKPGDEFNAEFSWTWQKGEHDLMAKIAYSEKQATEISSENNSLSIRTDALPIVFYIHEKVAERFRNTMNLKDSYGIQDWLQAHIQKFNKSLEESVYSSAPDGCRECIYADRIVTFENDPHLKELRETLEEGAQGSMVLSQEGLQFQSPREWNDILPTIFCKILGLVDLDALEVESLHNMVPGPEGYPLYWRYNPKKFLIGNPTGTYRLAECFVHVLNRQYGRPRGFAGDYYFAMAPSYSLCINDREGNPVDDARIRVYQKNSRGWVSRDPVMVGYTRKDGCFPLPNRPAPEMTTPLGFTLRPNPFGKIALNAENGLLLFEIRSRGETIYRWLDITDFNLAWWTAKVEEKESGTINITLNTDIPFSGAPSPPVRFLGGRESHKRLSFKWLASLSGKIKAYRIYTRKRRQDGNLEDFFMIKEIQAPADSVKGIHFSNEDAYYALTAVDEEGKDSPYSNWLFIPSCLLFKSLATTPEGEAYVYDQGIRRILFIDRYGRYHPFYLHHPEEPDMEITSLAWSPLNELAVCNAAAGRIDFYDQEGIFLRSIGSYGQDTGQLKRPEDVAFSRKGRIAVADSGNRRVQMFDQAGNHVDRIGEGVLDNPVALNFSQDGELHVVDAGRRNCVVFSERKKNKFFVERKYGNFRSPEDVIVSPGGTAYVSDPPQRGILVHNSDGSYEKIIRPGPLGDFDYTEPYGLDTDYNGTIIYVDRSSCSVRALPGGEN